MLKDMDEKGGIREMSDIDYRAEFDRKWSEFTAAEQQAIDAEIARLLDALRDCPDPLWGSGDADGIRASEIQHAVQGMNSDVHLGRATPVRA